MTPWIAVVLATAAQADAGAIDDEPDAPRAHVSVAGESPAADAPPALPATALAHRWGLGVHVGGGANVPLFFAAGPSVGLVGRARLSRDLVVEPHVTAFVAPLIALAGVQVGVPFIVERASSSGVRPHVGAGLTMTVANAFVGEFSPRQWLALLGAEALAGVSVQLLPQLEVALRAHAQLTHVPIPALPVALVVGGSCVTLVTF